MSLGPEREPFTRPVFVWLEVVARLAAEGEIALAVVIRQAMNDRRLGDLASVPLMTEEEARVDAVLQDWLGEQDPDCSSR